MRLTLICPAIGHRAGEDYIRSWQMEPLPAAALAGLTPRDIDVRFYDDRLEAIPYDEPTDAVALSVETYTARRAYQIASEYRRRKIPVIMGGFHATLVPEEVERYAEAVVVGQAESLWPDVLDDLRSGRLRKRYKADRPPPLDRIRVDRTIFQGKSYLPIALIETGRGCPYACSFCAVQTFFNRAYARRPVESVLNEIAGLKDHTRMFFFADDNFAGDITGAEDLLRGLEPLKVRWVTQMSIQAAHNEAFLNRMARAGCRGVLIGFESLADNALRSLNKPFNTMAGGYKVALAHLRQAGIRVYGTFVFGHDHETPQSFDESVDFAITHGFYIAAFSHLTPFPGTPLYADLKKENRLKYESWWLDPSYRFNDVAFYPKQITPGELSTRCLAARKQFYSWSSIARRWMTRPNWTDAFMARNFLAINVLHRGDVDRRNGYPLGDENNPISLLEAVK